MDTRLGALIIFPRGHLHSFHGKTYLYPFVPFNLPSSTIPKSIQFFYPKHHFVMKENLVNLCSLEPLFIHDTGPRAKSKLQWLLSLYSEKIVTWLDYYSRVPNTTVENPYSFLVLFPPTRPYLEFLV